MDRGCAFAFAVAFGAGACADHDSDAASTTEGGSIAIEDCNEITEQAECEAALPPEGGPDGCAWIDARRPGPACSDTTVVSQCVGLSYVGAGCQTFECPVGGSIDGFFRTVDGAAEVFASPECGLVPAIDEWTPCGYSDATPECTCLCEG